MIQERLNLYLIDMKYVRDLHHADEQIQRIDLGKMRTDTPADKHYKDLCINELTWCRRNQENIVNKANVLYSLCTESSNYKGKDRCLDYKNMEKICDKYNSKKK